MEEVYLKEIEGSSGGEDDIGVVTWTIPYLVASRSECSTVARGRIVDGLPEKSRSWSQGAGGLYIVTVAYEGQREPAIEPSSVRYSLRASWEEEAIEAHPKIEELMRIYNGRRNGDRIEFPMTYQPQGDGGLSKGDSEPLANPMFGVEKYKKLGVVWQRTYAVKQIPANILNKVGRIVDTPPGAPPEFQDRTKWLFLPPSADVRGNVVEITEEYMLLMEDESVLYTPESGIS